MTIVLIFAITLLLGVLLSGLANQGFASVVYGLLVLNSGIADAEVIFHLVALVIIGSIIAHSSTDVLIARWFQHSTPSEPEQAEPPGEAQLSEPA